LTMLCQFSIIHLSQLKFKTMIVYEFTMKSNWGEIHYLTPDQDVAEMDGQDTIIKWEANFAPEEYQNDDSEECRMKAKDGGYSYCNGLGWVKLIKQL